MGIASHFFICESVSLWVCEYGKGWKQDTAHSTTMYTYMDICESVSLWVCDYGNGWKQDTAHSTTMYTYMDIASHFFFVSLWLRERLRATSSSRTLES